MLEILAGDVHPYSFKLQFGCTNNVMGYKYLVQGMLLAQEMKFQDLIVIGDSKMIINLVGKKVMLSKMDD